MEILQAEGTSIEEMDINESYSYDAGEAYNNLVIEKVYDDVLSVEQYYTQRMDRMRDPEVRFDVSDSEDWTPIEYRQDPGIYRRDEDGLDLDGFLDTWDKNLKMQYPADEVIEGENRQ